MNEKKQPDRAVPVVRVSIAGLDVEAALEAIKNANYRAFARLRIPTRRFTKPVTLRCLDSKGRCIWAFSEVSMYYIADFSSKEVRWPESLFFIVAEDSRGRQARVRIELE